MLGINHFIEFHVHFINIFGLCIRRELRIRTKDSSSEDLDSGKCPLLPKIAISSLLAELVCSYPGCARLMAIQIFSPYE
jgi:hypothetical protein